MIHLDINCPCLDIEWGKIHLGQIQDFWEAGLRHGLPKAVPCMGVLGHPPLKNLKIEVFVNGISVIVA